MITHDTEFINKLLAEGQYFFFYDIEKEGILLYIAGKTGELQAVKPGEVKAIAQNYFDQ